MAFESADVPHKSICGFLLQAENRYMALLKENTELTSKVEEDEDDIESLTQKNRSLMTQVKISYSFSYYCPSSTTHPLLNVYSPKSRFVIFPCSYPFLLSFVFQNNNPIRDDH